MLVIVFFIIGVLIFLLNFLIKDKLSKGLLLIYLLWWGVCLTISTLNPYKLYEVSESTYFLLLLNVFSFYLGFVLCRKKIYKNKIKITDIDFQEKFFVIVNSKAFMIISSFLTIYVFFKMLKYIALVSTLSDDMIRMVRYEKGIFFSSGIELIFYNYVVEFFSFFMAILVCYCISIKKVKSYLFVISFIYTISFALIGGGRNAMVMLIFYLLFFLMLKKEVVKEKKVKSKNKVMILIIFFLAYISVVFTTAYRMGFQDFDWRSFVEGNDILGEHIVVYCTGSFRALDFALRTNEKLLYSYGRHSLLGFDDLLMYFFKFIGIEYSPYAEQLGDVTSEFFYIGNETIFNALFTCVFPFYNDFGVLGVIGFSFGFGYLYRYVISDFLNTKNIFSLMGVVFLSVCAIYSLFTWKFYASSSFLIMIFLYIKRKNIRISFK